MTSDNKPCPTDGHVHPNGIGVRICGCPDCDLLWTDIPRDLLAPEVLIAASRTGGE